MHVRTPTGKKIIHINKVLLWELGRVHVGKVIKLKKNPGISVLPKSLSSHEGREYLFLIGFFMVVSPSLSEGDNLTCSATECLN